MRMWPLLIGTGGTPIAVSEMMMNLLMNESLSLDFKTKHYDLLNLIWATF